MPKTKKNAVVPEVPLDTKIIAEIEKEVKKTVKNKYIDNERFLKELTKYFDDCKIAKEKDLAEPAIPNYIGECFMKIATNLSRKPNFMSYSYRDEMVMDGVENCIMYFRNFDPNKGSNPFSYFTQIIWYAFIRRISKEKKQSYIKYKYTEQHGIETLVEGQDDLDDTFHHRHPHEALYDNMADYIHNFEEKVEEKRKKRSKKQLTEDLPEEGEN